MEGISNHLSQDLQVSRFAQGQNKLLLIIITEPYLLIQSQ